MHTQIGHIEIYNKDEITEKIYKKLEEIKEVTLVDKNSSGGILITKENK